MKVFDKLIRVSKASFTEKLFDVDEKKLSKSEFKKVKAFLPSEEEKDFAEVFRSKNAQLARLQRKMSVCLIVEVKELEEEKVSFEYGKDLYTLTEPTDPLKLCQAIEKSVLDGFLELDAQRCVYKNGENVSVRTGTLKVDEIRILEKVADRFFFQTFLT